MALKIKSNQADAMGEQADDAAAMAPMEPSPMPSGNKAAVVATTSKDRYVIRADSPLPMYDSLPAVAYHATMDRDPDRPIMAYICDPKYPPRIDVLPSLLRVDHRCFMRVIDWAVVDWAPERRRCPAIIVDRPEGARVFSDLTNSYTPLSEELVIKNFIDPMAHVLRELHSYSIPHHNIRPDNLFFSGDRQSEIILGEGYVTPAGLTQDTVYESIEGGMVDPFARGEGTAEGDLYALGMTILALLTGKSPLAGLSPEAVVQRKLEMGSFMAAGGQVRLSLNILEPIKGLLNDDIEERWSLDELLLWLDGRRLSPKQQAARNRAARPITFNGKEYLTPRELAYGMSLQWEQALAPILDNSLDIWLRRSLSNEMLTESIMAAKGQILPTSSDEIDRLIGRVIIALDPQAPIRLRGLSTTIDGIGPAIAGHAEDAEWKKLFSRMVHLGLPAFWLDQQRSNAPDVVRYLTRLDRMKVIMGQAALGNGVERVIYEMNSFCPCLSPMFEADYVPSVDHILPALERLAAGGKKFTRMIDRHLAAFISTHFKLPISSELKEMEDPQNPMESEVAQVAILAKLQDQLHQKNDFKELCKAAAKFLEPSVVRFHSRETQASIREELRKAQRSGRLEQLIQAVNNPTLLEKDNRDFEHASEDYLQSVKQMVAIRHNIAHHQSIALLLSGQISTSIASLFSTAFVVLVAILRLV